MAQIQTIVKLSLEPYSAPEFPPKLQWHKIILAGENMGQILAAVELFQVFSLDTYLFKTAAVCFFASGIWE